MDGRRRAVDLVELNAQVGGFAVEGLFHVDVASCGSGGKTDEQGVPKGLFAGRVGGGSGHSEGLGEAAKLIRNSTIGFIGNGSALICP